MNVPGLSSFVLDERPAGTTASVGLETIAGKSDAALSMSTSTSVSFVAWMPTADFGPLPSRYARAPVTPSSNDASWLGLVGDRIRIQLPTTSLALRSVPSENFRPARRWKTIFLP